MSKSPNESIITTRIPNNTKKYTDLLTKASNKCKNLKLHMDLQNYNDAYSYFVKYIDILNELKEYENDSSTFDKILKITNMYFIEIVFMSILQDDTVILNLPRELNKQELYDFLDKSLEKNSPRCTKVILNKLLDMGIFQETNNNDRMIKYLHNSIEFNNDCLDIALKHGKTVDYINYPYMIEYSIKHSKLVPLNKLITIFCDEHIVYSPHILQHHIKNVHVPKDKFDPRMGENITRILLNSSRTTICNNIITYLKNYLCKENMGIIKQIIEHNDFINIISENKTKSFKTIIKSHKFLFSFLDENSYDYYELFNKYPVLTILDIVAYANKMSIITINVPENYETSNLIFKNVKQKKLESCYTFLKSHNISSLKINGSKYTVFSDHKEILFL